MSDTQKNREAIEAMRVAGADSISEDDQAELLEQAALQAALGPKRIRDREGNDIEYRDISELLEVKKHIGRQSSPFRTVQLIPGGTG